MCIESYLEVEHVVWIRAALIELCRVAAMPSTSCIYTDGDAIQLINLKFIPITVQIGMKQFGIGSFQSMTEYRLEPKVIDLSLLPPSLLQ